MKHAQIAPLMFAAPGDIARSMPTGRPAAKSNGQDAPAPAQPPVEDDDAEDDNTGAFGTLSRNPLGLSRVVFKAASLTAKAYTEGDRVTKKIANVLVELGNSGIFLKGSIKAVRYTGKTKPVVEFGFFGAQNQGQCISTDDPNGQIALANVKGQIVKLYMDWRKAVQSGAAAHVPTDAPEIDITL